MARLDPHSFTDSEQPQTRSIALRIEVDFAAKTVRSEIALRFREAGRGPLDLDTRDLRIESVEALDGDALQHELSAADPVLGSRLRVELPEGSEGVRIRCASSPSASA